MSSPVIPDPELTLSETVNIMGELLMAIKRTNGDAVLETAWNKLRDSAEIAGRADPEAMAALRGEIEMRKRFES